jgi:hypothetical protein
MSTMNMRNMKMSNSKINFCRKTAHGYESKFIIYKPTDRLQYPQPAANISVNQVYQSHQKHGGSRVINKTAADFFSPNKQPVANHSVVDLSDDSSQNTFTVVSTKYHPKKQVKNKMILHFNNRGTQGTPRTALNHASVFLNKNRSIEDHNHDDIPDENIDETSLSRVSDVIMGRGSVTNKLNKSMDSPFSSKLVSRKNALEYAFKGSANFANIDLASQESSPKVNDTYSRPTSIMYNPLQKYLRVKSSLKRQGKNSYKQSIKMVSPRVVRPEKLVDLANKIYDGRLSKTILKELKKVALEIKISKVEKGQS